VLGAQGAELVVNALTARLAEVQAWFPSAVGADFPKD
jgi:hypothetical protein